MPKLKAVVTARQRGAVWAQRVVGALLLLLLPAAGWGAPPAPPELDRLVQHGGVVVGEGDGIGYLRGPGSYPPASILKITTGLAALHFLGPDYRFRTEIYRDGANLIVRGYGDPFLVSEEWALLAEELREAGAFRVPWRDLVLDTSAFSTDLEVDGARDTLNPYDARLGALVSNFNTVFVEVLPDGSVRSAEPQTPLTPLARELARGLPPGEERINLSREPGHDVRYTGELVQAIFSAHGATFEGRVRKGRTPAGLKPLWVHRSSVPLRERVRGMLEFSNNFIANQLVLTIGLEREGEPAGLEKGMRSVRRFLREQVGLRPNQFHLIEGSGLSSRNRMDLLAMLAVVRAFAPWQDLLREFGPPAYRGRAKTGYLAGVYTAAGFLPAPEDTPRPFVIMLNQSRNTREAVYTALARAYLPASGSAATVR